jgi:hypothetical protein
MEQNQFSIQLKCFQFIGFQSSDSLKSRVISKALKFLNLFSLIFCVSSEVFFVLKNINNVLASAEAAGIIFISLISFSKLITFWVRKEKAWKIMADIKILNSKGKKKRFCSKSNICWIEF